MSSYVIIIIPHCPLRSHEQVELPGHVPEKNSLTKAVRSFKYDLACHPQFHQVYFGHLYLGD